MEAIIEEILENNTRINKSRNKVIIIFQGGYDLIIKILSIHKSTVFMDAKTIFDGLYDINPCFFIDEDFNENVKKHEISNPDLCKILDRMKTFINGE